MIGAEVMGDMDMWAVQEDRIADSVQVAACEQWARRRGTRLALNSAASTGDNALCTSGGVGVGARGHIGIRTHGLEPGALSSRVYVEEVNALVRGGFLLISVYLRTGVGRAGERRHPGRTGRFFVGL